MASRKTCVEHIGCETASAKTTLLIGVINDRVFYALQVAFCERLLVLSDLLLPVFDEVLLVITLLVHAREHLLLLLLVIVGSQLLTDRSLLVVIEGFHISVVLRGFCGQSVTVSLRQVRGPKALSCVEECILALFLLILIHVLNFFATIKCI